MTPLINIALPAKERLLVAQIWMRAVIFSTKVLHSNLVSRLAMMGMPRYIMGSVPSWKFAACRQWVCNSGVHPLRKSWDFWRFASSPAQCEKELRASFMVWMVRTPALPNKMRSSANIRWVSLSFLQFGWYLKTGSVLDFCIILEKYSMASTKRRGDKGSPYRRPLQPVKLLWMRPLRCRKNLTFETQAIIHLVQALGNRMAQSSSSRKPQWTESNAFFRLTFIIHLGEMCDLWYSRAKSWQIRTL